MPKIEFQIRWRISGEVQPPLKFGKLKFAKKKALELSKEKVNTSVQLGEVELDAKGNPSRLIQIWDFADGKETGHEIRDGVSPNPAAGTESNETKAETEPQTGSEEETGSTNEDETMKTPKTKKTSAKANAKAGKGKTQPKAGKSPAGRTSAKASSGDRPVTGKAALAGGSLSLDRFLAAFGVREGTNKAKLVTLFYENRNKTVALSEITKKVYGKTVTEEAKGAIKMVINGVVKTMEKEKLPFKLIKEKGGKDDKEICYGLETTK